MRSAPLPPHPDLAASLRLPLLAVGEATAKAATELGFTKVTAGPGTGEELSRLIADTLDPKAGALVHLAGETVAFDLKSALQARGFTDHSNLSFTGRFRRRGFPKAFFPC